MNYNTHRYNFNQFVDEYLRYLKLNNIDEFTQLMINKKFKYNEGSTKYVFSNLIDKYTLKFLKLTQYTSSIKNEFNWFKQSNVCFPEIYYYDNNGMAICVEYCNCQRDDVLRMFNSIYNVPLTYDRSMFVGLAAMAQLIRYNKRYEEFNDMFTTLYKNVINTLPTLKLTNISNVRLDQIKKFVAQVLSRKTIQDEVFYSLFKIYSQTDKYLLDINPLNLGITSRFKQDVLVIIDATI